MALRGKKRGNTVLERLAKSLDAVARTATPKNVHFFRTCCRRMEAYAELRKGEGARALRKLTQRLDKPRRLAGRVRDLDVQLDIVRDLHFDGDHESRRRLGVDLQEARARAARRLNKALDAKTVASLERRLRKAERAEASAAKSDVDYRKRAWSEAVALLAALPEDFPSVEPKNLHRLRLAGKNIRYTAEQAFPDPEARRFADAMIELQDAIGRWHDWLMLRKRARGLTPEEGTLQRILRSHERASLADALRRGRQVVRPHASAGDKKPSAQVQPPAEAATAS
ncbi:MAG: CHAD domain-containing protein [Acidobacteriota bacterium]|nr:CHAD domain-containing protein [Acidobacteriota bacterium]